MNCINVIQVFALIIVIGLMTDSLTTNSVMASRISKITVIAVGAWYLLGYVVDCDDADKKKVD